MVRRDEHGVTHWANPPTPYQHHRGDNRTGAFCDPYLNTYGDMISVPQEGPSCLWCVAVVKRCS
jgi:hypothetical protein